MADVKDLTSETFGLVIAYLLPGLLGVVSLSQWSDTVKIVLGTFLTENSNINLLLLVIVGALAAGMLMTALRGFVFERLLPSAKPLKPEEFAQLADADKFSAFRAIVDAHYRYHQCWGAMTFALPILYSGWLKNRWDGLKTYQIIIGSLFFIIAELAAIWAASDAYSKYVNRARNILKPEGASSNG